MDWLGGLSNIKGQISNITKDLLAESTTELTDPKSELEAANARIYELQSTVDTQKLEIVTLKSKNDELEVRLESAQLRLDHAREQFEKQLQEKEAIIRKLRNDMSAERGEPEGQPSALRSNILTEDYSTPLCRTSNFADDLVSEDYSNCGNKSGIDGSASRHELRNEVLQLRASVLKWRKIARQLKQKLEGPSGDTGNLVVDLEREIEGLRQKLAEAEENRQAEVVHLRQSHEERVTVLCEQLRDMEAEVLSLRTESEKHTPTPNLPICVDRSENFLLSTEEIQGDKNISKKKPPRGKKKKPRHPAEPPEKMPEVLSAKVSTTQTSKALSDLAVQTDSFGISTVDADGFDTLNTYRPRSPTILVQFNHAGQQTSVTTVCTSVQADFILDDRLPVSQLGHTSIAIQTSFEQISPLCSAADSDPSILVVGSDDHHSQRSDFSDASSCAHHLDELIHQLADEVNSYEHVVDQFVSSVACTSTPSTKELSVMTADETGTLNQLTELRRKLEVFQTDLRSRRDRLSTFRTAHHRKARNAQRYFTGSPEPLNGNSSTMSRLDTVAPTESGCVTEGYMNDWPDEDFTDIGSQTHDSVSGTSKKIFAPGDDKKTQTISRSDSSETLASDLRNTIRELETRLDAESTKYLTILTQFESITQRHGRLEVALRESTKLLTERLPSSVLSKISVDFDPVDWPPTDPETQLALLTSVEENMENELKEALTSLKQSHETIENLKLSDSDNHPPADILMANTVTGDQLGEVSEQDMLSVAHRLCMALDSEYTELNWDPDQWDALLYELLKPRFSDSALIDNQETEDDQVLRLSAEVTALRDILAQHSAFRSQAESDLRQLLSTVSTQREQIDLLSKENTNLKDSIAAYESSQRLDVEDRRTPIQRQSSQLSSASESKVSTVHCCAHLEQLIRSHCASVGLFKSEPVCLLELSQQELTSLFDQLSFSWSELQSRITQAQSMYESALNALQQKHTESQNYHTQLQRIYAELAASKKHNETLKQDIDELRKTVAHFQANPEMSAIGTDVESTTNAPSADRLMTEPSKVVSNEMALMTEINRLRSHLIEMEETYTAEALNAESREVQLRDQLNLAESRLRHVEELDKTVEQRIAEAQKERDEALSAADNFKKEVAVLRSSLTNLQSVLNSFQQSQQAAVNEETEHIRLEMRRLKEREQAAVADLEQLKSQIEDQTLLERRARELEEQLQTCESHLSRMGVQMEQRNNQIDSLRTRLAQMAVDTDSKIDKLLIKNLLVSFLQLPTSERANGLRVIGNVLHFTEEEYAKIDRVSGKLPKFFGWVRNAASVLPPGPPKDVTFSSVYPDKSFTDLLLTFLEQESHPGTPLRLPTEYYTPDSIRPSGLQHGPQAEHAEAEIRTQHVPTLLREDSPTNLIHSFSKPSESVVARNPLFSL